MESLRLKRRALSGRTALSAFFVAVIVASAAVALAADPVRISQKGQQFTPGEISLSKDEAIEIVNDDGDILHHAYVESDAFNFDSGDQTPGSHTLVVFSVRGTFNVLCGIHPRMKLVVHVK